MKIINKNSIAMLALLTLGLIGPTALSAAGPVAVNLGTAGNFVILAKTGISNTGTSAVVGDIGVSPAAATYITGFSLSLPTASSYATSALVIGKVYAPGYADPTPANITTAVNDMETAYTDGAGRTNPTATELGAGNIGGMTLAPGLYKWSSSVTIPADLTLSGSADDVWIFQIAQNLNVSSGVKVLLTGGAKANNVYWIVAGQTTIGTTAVLTGNILDQTAIVLNTGAQLNGRALAQSAVTLDSNTVMTPASTPQTSVVTPVIVVTPTATNVVTPTITSSSNDQTQLDSLSTLIQSLQAQIRAKILSNATPNASAVANANVNASFKRDITLGTIGADAQALQVWLNTHGYTVASSGAGSVGNETTTFGALTKAALVKFQKSVGITPSVGYFGAKTRAYIMANY